MDNRYNNIVKMKKEHQQEIVQMTYFFLFKILKFRCFDHLEYQSQGFRLGL